MNSHEISCTFIRLYAPILTFIGSNILTLITDRHLAMVYSREPYWVSHWVAMVHRGGSLVVWVGGVSWVHGVIRIQFIINREV